MNYHAVVEGIKAKSTFTMVRLPTDSHFPQTILISYMNIYLVCFVK